MTIIYRTPLKVRIARWHHLVLSILREDTKQQHNLHGCEYLRSEANRAFRMVRFTYMPSSGR